MAALCREELHALSEGDDAAVTRASKCRAQCLRASPRTTGRRPVLPNFAQWKSCPPPLLGSIVRRSEMLKAPADPPVPYDFFYGSLPTELFPAEVRSRAISLHQGARHLGEHRISRRRLLCRQANGERTDQQLYAEGYVVSRNRSGYYVDPAMPTEGCGADWSGRSEGILAEMLKAPADPPVPSGSNRCMSRSMPSRVPDWMAICPAEHRTLRARPR